jgi:hypothetical protein
MPGAGTVAICFRIDRYALAHDKAHTAYLDESIVGRKRSFGEVIVICRYYPLVRRIDQSDRHTRFVKALARSVRRFIRRFRYDHAYRLSMIHILFFIAVIVAVTVARHVFISFCFGFDLYFFGHFVLLLGCYILATVFHIRIVQEEIRIFPVEYGIARAPAYLSFPFFV